MFRSWQFNVSKKIWARTTLRVLKEIWIPAVIAFFWTIYSLRSKASWNFADAVQIFGGTFFILGYFSNYFVRSLKLVKDDDRHQALISHQEEILKEMTTTAEIIAGYATGGNGFSAVCFAKIDSTGKRNHISEIIYMVEGEYPLYDVNVRFFNWDDPITKVSMQDHSSYLRLGNITPKLSYSIQTNIPLADERANRIQINWQARNGSWTQRLEVRRTGDEWQMATFVKRRSEEIMVKFITEYEMDESGRPKFDLNTPTI